jgi:uncharacterized protein YeeX (DUF496 family)
MKNWLQKNEQIQGQISDYHERIKNAQKRLQEVQQKGSALDAEVNQLYKDLTSFVGTEDKEARIKQINSQLAEINQRRRQLSGQISQIDLLKNRKAVLEYRIPELDKNPVIIDTDAINLHQFRKEIFTCAIEALKTKRQKLNKTILEKLEGLILTEVNAFGLSNVSKVQITEDYDFQFTQNDKVEGFDELNEGEKLRVKLAFDLSIIQLDIEHQLGRHPRFIIFDSPGSEEMIDADIQGLSSILKQVNSRFGDNLQIFIGSAIREFSDISEESKTEIREPKAFIF